MGQKSVSLYVITSYDVVGPTLDYCGQEMESPFNLSLLEFQGLPWNNPIQ